MYQHLCLEEREKLYGLRKEKLSLRAIAKRLHRNVSSVSREIKRHTKYGRPYLPCRADNRAKIVAERQRYTAPLKGPLIFLYVREHLRKPYSWSPETIAGRLLIDHPGSTIDAETIYRYIYGRKQRRMRLWECLLHHRRKRMKHHGRKVTNRGEVVHATPIAQRPISIQNRKKAGHWETDNMEGQRSDHTGVSVTVERMTRVTRLRKLGDHTASTKTDALLDQFSHELQQFKKTITVDNGPENKDGGRFQETTEMTVYKTVPYHSWEKGSVENTVGRVRRWIPKKSSVDGVTQQDLDVIEDQMNNTPRKVLGFLTPNEVYGRLHHSSHKR